MPQWIPPCQNCKHVNIVCFRQDLWYFIHPWISKNMGENQKNSANLQSDIMNLGVLPVGCKIRKIPKIRVFDECWCFVCFLILFIIIGLILKPQCESICRRSWHNNFWEASNFENPCLDKLILNHRRVMSNSQSQAFCMLMMVH